MFQILFVCTGNRCRSPLAEVQLRQLARGLPIEVGSVGLLDLGPAPALPEMIEVARTSGLDLSAHRARGLSSIDLAGADLVIGLERTHVATAVVEGNAPYDKVFSFREIVRLLEVIEPPDSDDVVERARAAVARAHEARGTDPSFVPGEDIQDPFGGPREGYFTMARTVGDLSRRLLAGLVGAEHAARAASSL
jgi:low molecular weight protein-tyrosine phosphatase